MRIGITDTHKEEKYRLYVKWVQNADPAAETVRLSHLLDNAKAVDDIDGLVLTGGSDVHPRYYGRESDMKLVKDVNDHRDEFEFRLIERALDRDLPILGICRGMQVMNVALGGSLHPDLVTAGYQEHTSPQGTEARHGLTIHPHSLLSLVAGGTGHEVNTYHHQAVDALGRGLMAVAAAPDRTIEAAEWLMKENMPFLMLVQWHPERNPDDEFSQNLARMFLREVHHFTNTNASPIL